LLVSPRVALTSPAKCRTKKPDRDSVRSASQSGGERKASVPRRPSVHSARSAQRAERPQRVERQRAERRSVSTASVQRRTSRSGSSASASSGRTPAPCRAPHIQRRTPQRSTPRISGVPHASTQRIHGRTPQRIERQRIQQAERPQRIERQRVQQAERRNTDRLDRRQTLALENRTAIDRVRVQRESRRELPARFVARDDRQLARIFNDRPMRAMKVRDDRRIIAIGDRIDPARFSTTVPTVYRTRYYDTPDYYYRYDDDLGYLYQIDRDDDFVQALIPLFGGYGVGDPWPNTYYSSYVPVGYRSLYYDTPDYYYRSDGYGIYRVNAGTQLIAGLVALLSGQGFGVGQMLPASYGAYNVPMAYRSNYYDRNDAWYRYGDGFIYQVDPYSRRIDARYPIYGAGYDYMIGQQWPVAYPGYNVPLAYQPLYYDTPQYQYRYANGGIYQVDPTTQVIQALVALVSGQPLAIGQPLPAGYDTYNVPLAYRDRYYDTNDAWYRYADGYVYGVDPGTGLIEESFPIYT
jgi:hypothetical protein